VDLEQPPRADVIASFNDTLRTEGRGGRLMVTHGVISLPSFNARVLIDALASFDQFNGENDPYGERDFGAFEAFGVKLLWKIDYYDRKLEFASPDPANPELTVRVLTVMLVSEY
jgi:hypothetical protein